MITRKMGAISRLAKEMNGISDERLVGGIRTVEAINDSVEKAQKEQEDMER